MQTTPSRLRYLVLGTARRYGVHGDSQQAAAIAFRVLFSLVPLAALVVSVLDLVLPQKRRDDLVNWVVDRLSGSSGLEESLHRALARGTVTPSVAGLVSLVLLAWGATGMMAAIRRAFAEIWEVQGRTFVRGKLVDFALVFGTGVVLLVAFALSVVVQSVSRLGGDLGDTLGVHRLGSWLGAALNFGGTVAVMFGVLLALYSSVPPVRPQWRALWPGALFGALGIQLSTLAYRFYLSRFSDLSVVYGSLGALLGFLLVVYVAAIAMLLGAELVAARDQSSASQ